MGQGRTSLDDNFISSVLQANDFLTVNVRLVGGNLISDCPKCDHRAMISAKRGSDLEQVFPNNCTVPVASLCPHERMAVLLVLAQEAKLEGRVPDLGGLKCSDSLLTFFSVLYAIPDSLTHLLLLCNFCRHTFQ